MVSLTSSFIEIDSSHSDLHVIARGEWIMDNAAVLALDLQQQLNPDDGQANAAGAVIDVSNIERLDTSGAWLLERLRRRFSAHNSQLLIVGLTPEQEVLLDEVIESTAGLDAPTTPKEAWKPLEQLGKATVEIARDIQVKIRMLGSVVACLFQVFRSPKRLRGTSIVHHIDQTGFRAIPIILLMAFGVGAIIAQQAAFQLRYFGAEIFTVDLIGVLVLREIGLLITAIMVAGRSGSAFTAEIGSMKMREEIDALSVIGLSIVEVLVLPRVLALIIALPLLTVLADIAALLGGGLVAWVYSDIPPLEFISRLREAVWLKTLFVGFIKAPFMALVIAIVACSEGFAVKGSAESLGRRTTSSVVKAIFMVIVMDGFFAIFFASIGY